MMEDQNPTVHNVCHASVRSGMRVHALLQALRLEAEPWRIVCHTSTVSRCSGSRWMAVVGLVDSVLPGVVSGVATFEASARCRLSTICPTIDCQLAAMRTNPEKGSM